MRSPWSLLLAALPLTIACGGGTVAPIDGGNGDSGTGNDASTDAGSTLCPASAPTAGSKCTASGVGEYQCEYGSSTDRACNVVARCGSSGVWSITASDPNGCGVKNPPQCPATYATVPVGKSCFDAYPSDCSYPEGQCTCAPSGGPVPLDAAAAATWHCDIPSDSKCPRPRPKLGSACSTPDLSCDYGACTLPNGVGMACKQGMWVEVPVPCPL